MSAIDERREEEKREKFNRAHREELIRRAKNYDNGDWKAVLKEAPVEALFYALMHKIMRILDTNRKYEAVQGEIEKVYGDDEIGDWI